MDRNTRQHARRINEQYRELIRVALILVAAFKQVLDQITIYLRDVHAFQRKVSQLSRNVTHNPQPTTSTSTRRIIKVPVTNPGEHPIPLPPNREPAKKKNPAKRPKPNPPSEPRTQTSYTNPDDALPNNSNSSNSQMEQIETQWVDHVVRYQKDMYKLIGLSNSLFPPLDQPLPPFSQTFATAQPYVENYYQEQMDVMEPSTSSNMGVPVQQSKPTQTTFDQNNSAMPLIPAEPFVGNYSEDQMLVPEPSTSNNFGVPFQIPQAGQATFGQSTSGVKPFVGNYNQEQLIIMEPATANNLGMVLQNAQARQATFGQNNSNALLSAQPFIGNIPPEQMVVVEPASSNNLTVGFTSRPAQSGVYGNMNMNIEPYQSSRYTPSTSYTVYGNEPAGIPKVVQQTSAMTNALMYPTTRPYVAVLSQNYQSDVTSTGDQRAAQIPIQDDPNQQYQFTLTYPRNPHNTPEESGDSHDSHYSNDSHASCNDQCYCKQKK